MADRPDGRLREDRSRIRGNAGMFLVMVLGAVFRRRSRALMAVVASLVGAATLFCLMMVCLVVPSQMTAQMRQYGANLVVTPLESSSSSGSSSDDSPSVGIGAAMVRHTTRMVQAVGAARHATYRYENVRINAAPYVLAGIDVKQVRALNRHWSVEGSWPSSGTVLVGRDVADALGLSVGSPLTIAYRESDATSSTSSSSASSEASESSGDILDTGGVEVHVSGILDTGGSEDGLLYAADADVATITGTKRGADAIEYSVDASSSALSRLVRSINDMTSMHVQARAVTRVTVSDERIVTMLRTLFWVVSAVVLALTFVGVGTTISSIVSQRRAEIGLRKALGASSRGIATEFIVEAMLYGLVGGVLGCGIGYLVARVLCLRVFEADVGFDVPLAVAAILMSMALAVVASLPPVRRTARIDPAVVLSGE